MEKTSAIEYLKRINIPQDYVCFVEFEDKTVLHCQNSEFNRQLAQEKGYTIFDIPMPGGTIVLSEGDLAFGFVNKNVDIDYRKIVLGTFTQELKKLGLNAEMNNNDVTVDGYKCVGYVQSFPSPYLGVAISVSLIVNLEDISTICLKEMKKAPKGLGEYGVTKENIIDIFHAIENKIK